MSKTSETANTPDVVITSFGYLHDAPPADQDITLDLRRHFRDPHVTPGLRYLTAHDEEVREAVRNTAGIPELVAATTAAVLAYRTGPSAAQHQVKVASGCAGGLHRAGSVALELATALTELGLTVQVVHRDIDRDVVDRTATGEAVADPEPVTYSWEITLQYPSLSGHGNDVLTLGGTHKVRPGDTRTATREAIRNAITQQRPETRNASVLHFTLDPEQL
ncbi:RapZ C-terminal domain-containing protein [Kitasatospora cathayae]|uniref:RapZ C-terminal domain-containing protein n=1 Tax=Kitasatospora cathayae TaxID=3004092 RepID=UPI002FD7E170